MNMAVSYHVQSVLILILQNAACQMEFFLIELYRHQFFVCLFAPVMQVPYDF